MTNDEADMVMMMADAIDAISATLSDLETKLMELAERAGKGPDA